MIDQGELADAEPIIREKLARSQQHFGPVHPDVANSLHELAVVQWKRGELAEADGTLRQALAQFRQLQDQMETSAILGDLGLLQLDRGDLPAAAVALSEALETRKKLLPPEDPRRVLAGSNLALALWYEGDLAGAEALNREALEMDRKLYRAGSPNTAAVLNNLANVLRDRGDFAAAEPIQRECLAMVEKTVGQEDPHAAIARKNLAMLLRRYGSATADPDKLREALKLDPADAMTADALMNLLADPFLTPVAASLGTTASHWRWTATPPASNWMQADFSDAIWTSSAIVSGATTCIPHSYKNPINNHTNLWLRREFELSAVPPGKLVFRINQNHDAQIFLNGIEVVPTADWSDTEVVMVAAGANRAGLSTGRNLLAVHCTDADAGAPIDVRIYVTKSPGAWGQKLVDEFGRMIGNEPGRPELYASRANISARQGQWHEAAADLAKAIELAPADSTSWYQIAPLFLEMDDRSGYDRHRTQALARFAKTNDPVVGARIAFLALLVPAVDDDLANALELADRAALAEYPDGYLGWRQLVKGLAEYRRGRFTNSVTWMEKALATAGQPNLPGWSHELERNRKVTAYLVESMAYFQMHNPLAAQAALGQATEIIGQQLPSIDSGDFGRDWPGWIAAHLLLREAQILIQK
jgi:tetratricopeptide (TPR) repeat protein